MFPLLMTPIAGFFTIEDALMKVDNIPAPVIPVAGEKVTEQQKADIAKSAEEVARQIDAVNQFKSFLKTRIQATKDAKIIQLDVRFDFIGNQQLINVRIMPH